MKRSAIILLVMGFFVSMHAYAEDAVTTAPAKATETAAPAVAAAPVVPVVAPAPPADVPTPVVQAAQAPAPAAPAVAPAVAAPTPAPATETATANADNLEFISGEVGELDEAGKTITVKLYGETESATTDKTLKVSVDSTTDITDGEQDRDFKSLSVGTEVDVEYDPATNKATYIFVY